MQDEVRINLVFRGKAQMKVYNKLRDRAWKKQSKGMSEDIRSILYQHFFEKKEI